MTLLPLLAIAALGGPPAAPAPKFWSWAKTPPMGWNSWDGFATTITEAQTRAHIDVMADKLKKVGWQYIVVDIQWYEPNATGFDYHKGAKLEMDANGRLLPAVNKFPSATDGKGFRTLATYAHRKGLKLGVHLMRGIPRQAVAMKSPILGTSYTAADVADLKSTCPWNTDMYGVDMTKPGAQAYYDSVFRQLAEWGLDFVKVDDLSAPYHTKEIEAIRKAIDASGRPIVLSTSPGDTPLTDGPHVEEHANMWRISNDFWDNWPQLFSQFGRLKNWTAYRAPGHWPDADMLPLGTLEMGRKQTRFRPDEQVTLMSLWSIARSPLMVGADLTKLDDWTTSLLTNPEVLGVDQRSEGNRELFARDGFVGWMADVPGSKDRYLALFNTRPVPGEVDPRRAVYESPVVSRKTPGRGVPIDIELKGTRKLYLVALDGGFDADDAVWSEPTLVTEGGEVRLTDLKWASATTARGAVRTSGLAVGGKAAAFGIGAHARSVVEYDLPAGVSRFRAFAGLDDAGGGGDWGNVRFMVFTQSPLAIEASAPVPVSFSELGLGERANVRDLWTRKPLGSFQGSFAPTIPAHGAGMYRVSAR